MFTNSNLRPGFNCSPGVHIWIIGFQAWKAGVRSSGFLSSWHPDTFSPLRPNTEGRGPQLRLLPEGTWSHPAAGGGLAGRSPAAFGLLCLPCAGSGIPSPRVQGSPTMIDPRPARIGCLAQGCCLPPAWASGGEATVRCCSREDLGRHHSETDSKGTVAPVGCPHPLSLTTTAPRDCPVLQRTRPFGHLPLPVLTTLPPRGSKLYPCSVGPI